MSGHPDLSCENYVVAHVRRSAQAHLRAQHRVLPNLAAVAYLHQIVDLGIRSDHGFADAGAVHAGVCLHFHPVCQPGDPGLHNLVPSLRAIPGKSKTVCSDHNPVLQRHVISQLAILAHLGVRVGEKPVPNPGAPIDHDMGQQHGIVAERGTGVDHNVGSDVRAGPDLSRRINHRRWMNSGLILWGLIEKLQGARKCQIGIGMTQHRTFFGREVRGYQNRRRAGGFCLAGIFRIGNECDLLWAGFFNTRHAGDFGLRRSILQGCTQKLGNFRKFHAGD